MPIATLLPAVGPTVRCIPSSVILPSSGCQSRSGRVRPSSGSSESMVCFHRFSQFLRGPTTKASSSLTGPCGSSAALATAVRTSSLKATDDADAVVLATSRSLDGGAISRAASIRTNDCSWCCFVHHTDTSPGSFRWSWTCDLCQNTVYGPALGDNCSLLNGPGRIR
jgi:hypothetical protein